MVQSDVEMSPKRRPGGPRFLAQIEAKLELRLEHIQRDERLNVFDREELRFNLFREVFEETALELKTYGGLLLRIRQVYERHLLHLKRDLNFESKEKQRLLMEFEDLQRNFMEMQEAAVVGSQDSSRNESKEARCVFPPGLPPPIPPQDSEVFEGTPALPPPTPPSPPPPLPSPTRPGPTTPKKCPTLSSHPSSPKRSPPSRPRTPKTPSPQKSRPATPKPNEDEEAAAAAAQKKKEKEKEREERQRHHSSHAFTQLRYKAKLKQMQSMVETLEMERKDLLDRVKKLERCERQERDRFLRERTAKEAVLQEYNGLQKSFDRFKEILKEQEDPVILRLALNQSRRDLSDAQGKLNEYRYVQDNDNDMAQTAFDDLERRYERLRTEMAQMSSRERSLRATNDELLVSLEEVTRQLEQSRNDENLGSSGKTEE